MNEFLNPKSMLTPGIAGALMMFIANGFCSSFPEFPFRYVALILSFVIGAVVFTAATMKVWERGIYWLVNSLIIFSMSVGATNIAANEAAKLAPNEHSAFVASAQAGKTSLPATSDPKNQVPVTSTTSTNQSNPSSEAELNARIKAGGEVRVDLRDITQRLQQQSKVLSAPTHKTTVDKRAPESFFRKW